MKLIGYDSDSFDFINIKPKRSYFKDGMICCYCNIKLTIKTCTREHIIPKSQGGKIIKPCCKNCNKEKANMTLFWYVKWLKSNVFDNKELSTINSIKISNAEKLLSILNKL